MKKKYLSFQEKFERKISFFSKNLIVSLLIIGFAGFLIRIIFLDFTVPMNSDNFVYFRYAGDIVVSSRNYDGIANNGWPVFLSLFFSLIPSEQFLDYMLFQKLLTISLSVLTIIPIYLLARKFLNRTFSLFSTLVFIFEPRVIQNSLFGITEPLYIITLTISMTLLFSEKYFLRYISFVILSLAILIRSEGLFLLPIFFIIFFFITKKNFKSIIHYFIISALVILVLLPASILRTEEFGHDGLTNRINMGIEHMEKTSSDIENGTFSMILSGIFNMLKFFTWSQIPYLIFFVPLGIFLFFKSRTFFQKAIIILGVCILIPTIYPYAYANDTRYILPLYPIFSIISGFSVKFLLQRKINKKIPLMIIICLIISSSILFLEWKNIDENQEIELYNLSKEVASRTSTINEYFPESSYLNLIGLYEMNKFPAPSVEYLKNNVKIYWYEDANNLEELIKISRKNESSYLVIDENPNRKSFIKEILIEENNFPYLVKIFDSIEEGYQYKLNIYKIDYEKFDNFYNLKND